MNERGQRGKTAEKAVEAVLKKWNVLENFAYFRLPDARAAMGRLTAQPGDFMYYSKGNSGVVEVKETRHPARIAKGAISQLPVLHKLQIAGAKSVIVINHSTLNQWRAVTPTQLPIGPASWDLSGFPLFNTAEEAMLSTGVFYCD